MFIKHTLHVRITLRNRKQNVVVNRFSLLNEQREVYPVDEYMCVYQPSPLK